MEDYIKIDTAKLAKEKGFNLRTYEYYIGDVPVSSVPQKENHNKNWGNIPIEYTTRPTQSVLQKWLRIEHHIFVSPRESWSYDNKLAYVCTVNGSYVNHDIPDKPFNRYDEYEDAFEDGLRFGLNLI